MKVKFLPSGEEHEIEFNETILHLAQRHGIHIQSVCKGIPSCAECRVRIIEGEHHVLPPSSKEVALIGTAHYVDLSRLSCQLRCFGDVTIDLQEQLDKEKRAQQMPKSRERSDGQESKAILGNMFESVDEFDDELDKSSEAQSKSKKSTTNKKLDNRDAFYGDFYKEKSQKKKAQKKKSKGRGRGGSKSRNPEKSASEKGPKKSGGRNNRRRRRSSGGAKGSSSNQAQ